jgi:hypothetical protein
VPVETDVANRRPEARCARQFLRSRCGRQCFRNFPSYDCSARSLGTPVGLRRTRRTAKWAPAGRFLSVDSDDFSDGKPDCSRRARWRGRGRTAQRRHCGRGSTIGALCGDSARREPDSRRRMRGHGGRRIAHRSAVNASRIRLGGQRESDDGVETAAFHPARHGFSRSFVRPEIGANGTFPVCRFVLTIELTVGKALFGSSSFIAGLVPVLGRIRLECCTSRAISAGGNWATAGTW